MFLTSLNQYSSNLNGILFAKFNSYIIYSQICGVQNELAKCHKELNSFQKMEETYRSNPKFGNSNQLRAEMDQVRVKIAELESALAAMRKEHAVVESRLGSLRSRSPNPPTRGCSEESPEGLKRNSRSGSRSGSSNDSGSLKSSNLSIGSSAVTSTGQVVYDIPENSYNNQVSIP